MNKSQSKSVTIILQKLLTTSSYFCISFIKYNKTTNQYMKCSRCKLPKIFISLLSCFSCFIFMNHIINDQYEEKAVIVKLGAWVYTRIETLLILCIICCNVKYEDVILSVINKLISLQYEIKNFKRKSYFHESAVLYFTYLNIVFNFSGILAFVYEWSQTAQHNIAYNITVIIVNTHVVSMIWLVEARFILTYLMLTRYFQHLNSNTSTKNDWKISFKLYEDLYKLSKDINLFFSVIILLLFAFNFLTMVVNLITIYYGLVAPGRIYIQYELLAFLTSFGKMLWIVQVSTQCKNEVRLTTININAK